MMSHTFSRSRFLPIHAWSVLFGLLLSGCSTLGSVDADTFILKGELPADFALKAQAHYGGSEGCSGRGHVKGFKKEYENLPHGYEFEIPVSYRDGLCELRLVRVGLFIHARYGKQDWQETYDNGGLMVVEKLSTNAPAFQPDGTLSKAVKCSWLFQISKAKARKDQISKLLSCNGAGAEITTKALAGKVVKLSFILDLEEEPYRDNTWVKFSNGWKPCLPKEGWQQCQDPPIFRSFKRGNQECTAYPNCTE